MALFPTKPVPALLATDRLVREQRGRPRRKRLRRPRRQRIPRGVERDYRSEIFDVLERARELVNKLLIPRLAELESRALITVDADDLLIAPYPHRAIVDISGLSDRADVERWAEALARIVQNIREQFAPAERVLEVSAQVAVNRTSAFNKQQITNQLKGVLGVDIFLAEPELADELAAAVAENVAKIESIPAQYFDDIEAIVLRGFRAGRRAEVLGEEISDRFGVSRKRGAFIARDQIETLNGNLTRNRQINLGIPGYIWRTALDERVRPSHADLEGEPFGWDDPPVTNSSGDRNHPGQDFNCRCVAEPDFSTLL